MAGISLSLRFAFVVGCAAALGCNPSGPPRGKVEGKVTLDGAPLSQAVVVFDNEAKAVSVTAPTGADGTYVVKTHDAVGLPPGDYRVAVRPPDAERSTDALMQKPEDTSPIPQSYRDFATSGLTLTVTAGENKFDIPLKKPAAGN